MNYTRHKDVVYRAAWSPDGKDVASGSYDSTVRVWEAMSGKHLLTYDGHSALIFALGWSPDSQRLASGSYDSTVQVWNASNGRTITSFHGHKGQVQGLSWSPDGTRIVSCGGDGIVRLWDANNGQEIFAYRGHETPPVMQPLISNSYQSMLADRQIYRLSLDQPIEISAVAWSPDGKWIASGGTDRLIHVWKAE